MPERTHDRIFSLSGRTAVVTGASRGIGEAIAVALARAGADVLGLSRTGRGEGGSLSNLHHRACDVTDSENWQPIFEKELKQLDILVNAAGISIPASQPSDDKAAVARFRNMIEANLAVPYGLTLAALPLLRRSANASVINITSINSQRGFPDNPGYVAAKAGLAGLTRALAVDFGKYRIRVNAIAPGYVHTNMTSKSFADPLLNEQRRRHTLLGRWGMAEEIGSAAVFLASDASSYMTGQEMFVDGGWIVNGMVDTNPRGIS